MASPVLSFSVWSLYLLTDLHLHGRMGTDHWLPHVGARVLLLVGRSMSPCFPGSCWVLGDGEVSPGKVSWGENKKLFKAQKLP